MTSSFVYYREGVCGRVCRPAKRANFASAISAWRLTRLLRPSADTQGIPKKYEGAEGLILRRRRHSHFYRQMIEELLHFRRTHFGRVPFPVKKDVSLNPIYVRGFSPQTVMFAANRVPHLIQEAWFHLPLVALGYF